MTRSIISKDQRIIWSRRIKNFWEEYSHNKIGLVGLTLLILYAAVAISAPLLTPYDPIKERLISGDFAMPEWMAIFPQFENFPRNMEIWANWIPSEVPESVEVVKSGGAGFKVRFNGSGTRSVYFTTSFTYAYVWPKKVSYSLSWGASNVTNARYSLELYLINPAGTEFILWSNYVPPATDLGRNKTLEGAVVNSRDVPYYILAKLLLSTQVTDSLEQAAFLQPSLWGTDLKAGLVNAMFLETGEYKIKMKVQFGSTSDGNAEVSVENGRLRVFGQLHGMLGTDSLGRDIFSQLVYGARISLAVGLLSAFLATSIGLLVGITSGYVGGLVDESLMRTVDVLLCLPVLPLLLALMMLFGTSVWLLVILIALFGWLGLSRVIRSRILSLKEMPFIECARAAGATRGYIMIKHMLPNVLPVALAALILSVPGAIMTEAAISFIGLGDPSTPTWGRMLNYAFGEGGFWHLAWWWILPPGLAIIFLTLAFVFVGHALDEIINPRLRRRR